MSAIPGETSVEAGRMRRGVPNVVRFLVSFFVALLYACATLFDLLARLQSSLPAIVFKFLHLPGYLYCEYLKATEPLPADDIPLFEMGQAVSCWFAGIALDIPYHTLLIFGAWWLVDYKRRSASVK